MLSTQLTTPNYQVKKSGQHTSSQTTSTLHIYSLIQLTPQLIQSLSQQSRQSVGQPACQLVNSTDSQ